jgi:hypothetical protein
MRYDASYCNISRHPERKIFSRVVSPFSRRREAGFDLLDSAVLHECGVPWPLATFGATGRDGAGDSAFGLPLPKPASKARQRKGIEVVHLHLLSLRLPSQAQRRTQRSVACLGDGERHIGVAGAASSDPAAANCSLSSAVQPERGIVLPICSSGFFSSAAMARP